VDPPTALVVSKTANGSYNRSIDWDLTKSVDPASHNGTAGANAGTSTWSVTATKSVSESGFSVSGTITISNPNTSPVAFEVNDVLSDRTVAIVTCPAGGATGTVPGKVGSTNGSITCSYTASPADASATSNNALVTSLTSGVPGGTALQTITWTPTLVGSESAQLVDTRPGININQTVTGNTTLTPTELFACSSNEADYAENGQYTRTETNTATLTGQNVTGSPASASVEITCTLPPLTAEKTAEGTYTKRITWNLTKSASPTSFSGTIGQTVGPTTWTINVTKSSSESGFGVTGSITISNTAGIARTLTSVTDQLSDGTSASVTCPLTSGAIVVPATGALVCTYTASPGGRSAASNTATIEYAMGTLTPSAAVIWTPTLVGSESAQLVDTRPGININQTVTGNTTLTPPESFQCSNDASLYTNNNSYSFTETNRATLTGQNITGSPATATVTVTCTRPPPAQGETATGAGYKWSATQGAPSNWFMYTPWSATNISPWGRIGISTSAPLIAGQHHVAGTITGTRTNGGNGSTSITITLNSNFNFAPGVSQQVKIQPMSCATNQPYVSPGQFAVKRDAPAGKTITVTGLSNTACYGIHVDVVHSQ
jgi:hypothetical protein